MDGRYFYFLQSSQYILKLMIEIHSNCLCMWNWVIAELWGSFWLRLDVECFL